MTGERAATGYTVADQRRWVDERPKRRQRTSFERDRARVLHSSALRRLAAKTQVVEPSAGSEFGLHSPRTRLTHSLECAQIGRELGAELGCDPDLVETACLAHDLGHPPFGHNGETALDVVAAGCGGFEGNAQSLRLLTRLEAKVIGPDGRSAGLNLTRATLDATLKYPWGKRPHEIKYGVYPDDTPAFDWVRDGLPESVDGRPCFEAQVMDWSDDVAYSVHDLEDGLLAGHIDLTWLRDPGHRRDICAEAATWYVEAPAGELAEALKRLLAEPFWPETYDGSLPSLAGMKNLTSELIGRFCRAAERATRAVHGGRPLRRYDADLVVPRAQRLECALLKAVAARYVLKREGVADLQAEQRRLILELAEMIADGAPETLEPALRPAYVSAEGDAVALRVVVDQVASLTDSSALAMHRRLAGRVV
ncbi:MAG: deoxyguanosinetriphosphate triphosphohydrolase [Streptosporangiales bacterium]|nr:deoxyguanosinetriphosphate triphosphohydrolase [Streptosporangiales bacterium]